MIIGKHNMKRRGMKPSSNTIKLHPGYPFSGPAFVIKAGNRIFVVCYSSLGIYGGWYLITVCDCRIRLAACVLIYFNGT